jgi:hypothetical protein
MIGAKSKGRENIAPHLYCMYHRTIVYWFTESRSMGRWQEQYCYQLRIAENNDRNLHWAPGGM